MLRLLNNTLSEKSLYKLAEEFIQIIDCYYKEAGTLSVVTLGLK